MAGTSADKLAYLQATKEAIRQAITSKGVDVPETTPFRQYSDKIGEIQSGAGKEYVTCTLESTLSKFDLYVVMDTDAGLIGIDFTAQGTADYKVVKDSIIIASSIFNPFPGPTDLVEANLDATFPSGASPILYRASRDLKLSGSGY